GNRQLLTAGRRDIADFLLKLLAEQVQPRSVARKVSVFRQFFRFLLLDRVIQADPMARIESPSFGRILPKTLTVAEMATALEEIRSGYRDPHAEPTRLRDCAVLELLYGGGLRASEVTGARLSDLNMIDRFILVRGKGDKERIVPFGLRAADALSRYLAHRHDPSKGIETVAKKLADPDTCMSPNEVAQTFGISLPTFHRKMRTRAYPRLKKNRRGWYLTASVIEQRDALPKSFYLFPGRDGRRMTRENLWHGVRKVSRTVGRKVSPHMLRHACATHLLENGANLRVIQEILGHADIGTTELYTHVTTDGLKKAFLEHHPRATDKSSQLKLQLDLIGPEILAAGPVLCLDCSQVAAQGKRRCQIHLRKAHEAKVRFQERAKPPQRSGGIPMPSRHDVARPGAA
ncbi:MAG: tyrosine-type recombinase/integrase, partial [Terriglobales bacterium]